MSNDKNLYNSDRVLTIQDERERILVLSEWALSVPVVGIHDEPTRCYRVNVEWAKIITGAISILTEVAVWKDASDEGYAGIRQIIQLLEGENCMDCNDVAACQAIIDLQNAINTLDSRVTQNETDIAANVTAITAQANTLNQHGLDIANLQTENNTQQNEIIVLQGESADYENRITALENAGGGGATIYKTLVESTYDPSANISGAQVGVWSQVDSNLAIEINLQGNGLTIVHFAFMCDEQSAGNRRYQFRISDGVNHSGFIEIINDPQDYEQHVDVIAKFVDLQAGLTTFYLEWTKTNGVPEIKDSIVSMSAYEIAPLATYVEPVTDYLIDFSASGHGWTEHVANQGTFSAQGGNPAECYVMQSPQINDKIVITPDAIAETTIQNVKMDVWADNGDVWAVLNYLDAVIGGGAIAVTTYGQWVTVDFALQYPASWPITVNSMADFDAFISNQFSGQNEMRLDNIRIYV